MSHIYQTPRWALYVISLKAHQNPESELLFLFLIYSWKSTVWRSYTTDSRTEQLIRNGTRLWNRLNPLCVLEGNGKTLAIVQCVESRPCSLIIRNMYSTKPKTSFYLEILVPSTCKTNPWLNKHPSSHYGKKKLNKSLVDLASHWSG